MKTLAKISVILIVINMGLWAMPDKASAMRVNVSFQLFYDQLSPYGTWVYQPDYGYVWIPDVTSDFSPYATDGHWELTDYGWTWVSDFEWGWAPFHYGRWLYDEYYGYMWVPDNEWGPAWVTWRRSNGYYGWTPMAPGISVNITFGRNYYVPYDRWIFVRDRDFCRHDIYRYYVNNSNNVTIINNSTIINNTYVDNSRHITYVTGPARQDVQRRTGRTVKQIAVRDNERPGQSIDGNQLRIYRPNIEKETRNGSRYAPARAARMQDIKPLAERNSMHSSRDKNSSMNREYKTPARNEGITRNQRNEQPIKNIEKSNRQRVEQPARNVEQVNRQRNEQPVRNVEPANRQRNEQPVRNVEPANRQRNEQPVRNVEPANRQRNEQPAKYVESSNRQNKVQQSQIGRSPEKSERRSSGSAAGIDNKKSNQSNRNSGTGRK